jgi:bifunctional DNA-binding transcriptional regulator/antitoxin component of YhaV-PrlF toxin-antitoxin module
VYDSRPWFQIPQAIAKVLGLKSGDVIALSISKPKGSIEINREAKGAKARKIQSWLGHSDLETTLRCLALTDDNSDEVRDIV